MLLEEIIPSVVIVVAAYITLRLFQYVVNRMGYSPKIKALGSTLILAVATFIAVSSLPSDVFSLLLIGLAFYILISRIRERRRLKRANQSQGSAKG